MPEDNERIDLGAELNQGSRFDDQLLKDLKDAAAEQKQKKIKESKEEAKDKARSKFVGKYSVFTAVAAVVLLIVAFFIIMKPGAKEEPVKTTGERPVPQTTIAAPAPQTQAAPAPMNVPQQAPQQPDYGYDAGGYEPPM